jgi:hypothetical protein
MRQEGRHIDFYASQAERRLAASRRAQRATRWALRRLLRPVGAGVMPPAETRFVTQYLFGATEGRRAAGRIDRRIDRLPGLGGLHLLEQATGRPAPGCDQRAHRRGSAASRPDGRPMPAAA